MKSIYGLSAIRDIWSGDVTSDGIEFIIKAEANGAQDATLDTADVDVRSIASAPLIEDRAFLVFAKPVSGSSSIKITMNMREDW